MITKEELTDMALKFVNEERRAYMELTVKEEDLIIVVGGEYSPVMVGKTFYGIEVKPILTNGVTLIGMMLKNDFNIVKGTPYGDWASILGRPL